MKTYTYERTGIHVYLPDRLHRKLKEKARREGKPMSRIVQRCVVAELAK